MSEAKTKAVQAEAKQEAKTVAKTQETMVYAGPTILGAATHNQFFNNGLPDGLKTAMEKEPAIYNLVADQQSGGRERRHRITERCRLCIL